MKESQTEERVLAESRIKGGDIKWASGEAFEKKGES